MSNQNTGLPDPQTAFANVFTGVHAEVFFHKLAQAGHYPQTQEEAQVMLETGATLWEASQHANVKQAGMADNPYFQMKQSLDATLAQNGLVRQVSHADVETGYKQAAAQLMENPDIYNSVLALKVNEAQQLQTHYENQQR